MSRFYLTPAAMADLDDLGRYLKSIPAVPAKRIGTAILRMINAIEQNPHLGRTHSRYSLRYGREVCSRLTAPYRIYYFPTQPPQIIAILHTSRDQSSIMENRAI